MFSSASLGLAALPADYHLVETLSVTRLLYLAQQITDFETVFLAELSDEAVAVLDSLHVPVASQRCVLDAPANEPLENTYCQFVYRTGKPLVVTDARHTMPFAELATTHTVNIGAYIGVPLISRDGAIFGTLCGIHPAPKTLTPNQIMLLQIVGKTLIDLIERDMLLTQLQADANLAEQSRDAVTGLPDRLAFELALQAAILQASATTQPLSVMMVQTSPDILSAVEAARSEPAISAFAYDAGIIALILADMVAEAARQWTTMLGPGAHAGIATYPTLAASQQALVAAASAALAAATERGDAIVVWTADMPQALGRMSR